MLLYFVGAHDSAVLSRQVRATVLQPVRWRFSAACVSSLPIELCCSVCRFYNVSSIIICRLGDSPSGSRERADPLPFRDSTERTCSCLPVADAVRLDTAPSAPYCWIAVPRGGGWFSAGCSVGSMASVSVLSGVSLPRTWYGKRVDGPTESDSGAECPPTRRLANFKPRGTAFYELNYAGEASEKIRKPTR